MVSGCCKQSIRSPSQLKPGTDNCTCHYQVDPNGRCCSLGHELRCAVASDARGTGQCDGCGKWIEKDEVVSFCTMSLADPEKHPACRLYMCQGCVGSFKTFPAQMAPIGFEWDLWDLSTQTCANNKQPKKRKVSSAPFNPQSPLNVSVVQPIALENATRSVESHVTYVAGDFGEAMRKIANGTTRFATRGATLECLTQTAFETMKKNIGNSKDLRTATGARWQCCLAKDGSDVKGICVTVHTRRGIHIVMIYVLESDRKSGIGRGFIENLKGLLNECVLNNTMRPCSSIIVSLQTCIRTAKKFYEGNHGFKFAKILDGDDTQAEQGHWDASM